MVEKIRMIAVQRAKSGFWKVCRGIFGNTEYVEGIFLEICRGLVEIQKPSGQFHGLIVMSH
jgi:hypothetical protein